MAANSEAILNHRYLQMVKLLNIYLNHFPKHEKYALANIIRNTAYEIFDLITECQKRYFKKTSLTQLDVTHEKLKIESIISLIGHAKSTATMKYYKRLLIEANVLNLLPIGVRKCLSM